MTWFGLLYVATYTIAGITIAGVYLALTTNRAPKLSVVIMLIVLWLPMAVVALVQSLLRRKHGR